MRITNVTLFERCWQTPIGRLKVPIPIIQLSRYSWHRKIVCQFNRKTIDQRTSEIRSLSTAQFGQPNCSTWVTIEFYFLRNSLNYCMFVTKLSHQTIPIRCSRQYASSCECALFFHLSSPDITAVTLAPPAYSLEEPNEPQANKNHQTAIVSSRARSLVLSSSPISSMFSHHDCRHRHYHERLARVH